MRKPKSKLLIIVPVLLAFVMSTYAYGLKKGDVFVGEKGHSYTVERYLGGGGGGYVYLATSETGSVVAIKFVRTDVEETEELRRGYYFIHQLLREITGRDYQGLSFSELATVAEMQAMATAQKYGINHAKILEHGRGYVVKEYLGETTGERLLRAVITSPQSQEAFIKLKSFISSMTLQGLAPHDFKPSNIMWAREDWHLVDLLALKETANPRTAEAQVLAEYVKEWRKHLSSESYTGLAAFLFGRDACHASLR